MKIKKSHVYNLIFFVIIVLFIVPQTRKPIQIGFNKVLAIFGPSISKDDADKVLLSDYNWQLLDTEGNNFDFQNTKGKVVLVNLWATWCPPCIAEMPSMNDLYKDYKDKVVFLFVTNERLEKANRFLQRKEWQIPAYQTISDIPMDLYSRSIPATFVIGKDGMIHVDKRGAANWNSDGVRELLDTLVLQEIAEK
jgi:thiol-disulfide isomerase/thioredoxin